MDFKDELGRMISRMMNDLGMGEKNRVIKKTVPMTKEWKAKWTEISDLVKKLEDDMGKLQALRNAFWSEISLKLNEFGGMQVNSQDNEIDIFDEKSEKGGIKSPYHGRPE